MSVQEFIEEVEGFKGECFSDYASFTEYVEQGGWEKDYFSAWLEGCSDYPYLDEIEKFCQRAQELVEHYLAFMPLYRYFTSDNCEATQE